MRECNSKKRTCAVCRKAYDLRRMKLVNGFWVCREDVEITKPRKKVVRAWAILAYGQLSYFNEACIYETQEDAIRSFKTSRVQNYLDIVPCTITYTPKKGAGGK